MAEDSLLREIDEELRQEHYAKLWKKYGIYIIGLAVLIVVGVAGYKGWQYYSMQQRLAAGQTFAAAQTLAADKKTDAAIKAFQNIVKDGDAGYSLLARFQDAGLLLDKGDRVGAAAAYQKITQDSAVDPLYRDLATVLGVLVEFDTANPDDLRLRLEPVTVDGNPWRFSARELTALLDLRAGDRDKAQKLFKSLADDPEAPGGIRARARQHLAMLKG